MYQCRDKTDVDYYQSFETYHPVVSCVIGAGGYYQGQPEQCHAVLPGHRPAKEMLVRFQGSSPAPVTELYTAILADGMLTRRTNLSKSDLAGL